MAGGPVGALRVTLGANTANYEQGMRRAAAVARRTGQDMERSYVRMTQSGVRAFSTIRTGLAGIASVAAGSALVNFARDSLHWAAGLSETAQQIGVTVEQLQALRLAAEQNGASVEGMERAMGILNRTLGQAQAGLPQAVRAFASIGISKDQLQSFRNGGEALQAVITALSNLRNPAQQAAAAQALFGRGARELMVMLTQGAGAMHRWTEEARRAGVITDEQARKADEAEDALNRLATTIRANLAGALADAMPGILAIIDALGRLAVIAIRVIGLLSQLTAGGASFISPGVGSGSGDAVRLALRRQFEERWRQLGSPRRGTPEYQRAIRDPQLRQLAPGYDAAMGIRRGAATPATTGDTDLDLSPARSGGGGRRNNEAARRAHEFDNEQRRLQIEALQSQLEGTQALDERNEIQGRIAAAENEQWLADLRFRQGQKEINQTQANRLIELKNQLIYQEALSRSLEYNQRVAEQENQRAEQQEGYARDRAQFEADMAQTMEERRRLELDMLRITIEQRRRALQGLIDQANARRDPDAAAKAQLELDNLGNVQSRETRRIMRDTRGPLEAFMAGLPQTAAQITESLQSIAVDGLQSISDGLVDVITGARKMGDVFKSVVTSIISDLLRIQIQRSIIGPLANALSGIFGGGSAAGTILGDLGRSLSLPGRAAGGPVLPGRMYVVGEKGPELLRMGSTGGHVIANDNIGGSGVVVNQYFQPSFAGNAATKQEMMYLAGMVKPMALEAYRDLARRRG